ncbi:MAG: AAA family ATPase [Clostridia bacterium]|nr:AAA family ATPase [Clostridia bacterium]
MEHGKYVNPGNTGFQRILKSKYIDKTGLIDQINQRMNSTEGLVCISRPRRFGKSFAAQMLCAYYDCSCDSHALFDDKNIAKTAGYREHVNQYNVVCFDVTSFISVAKRLRKPVGDVTNMIVEAIHRDLIELFDYLDKEQTLMECFLQCVETEGKQFVFIIDEWDAIFREAKEDTDTQEEYLNLLREWFKNISFTPKVVAAAYMTGILPIKKDGSQSAISDFVEYPILYPDGFAEFTGFTAGDVQGLCHEYGRNFEEFKTWYDGYEFSGYGSIYNPYSVMRAIRDSKCRSYWQKTSAAEALFTYINMDFEGLRETVSLMIAGESIEIDVDAFENDFETFNSKDDVLTLLVHLGYLTYHEDDKTVRIPNEEVRNEFTKVLKGVNVSDQWLALIRRSQKLLDDTLKGDEKAVAETITRIRGTEYAPTLYNNEQALRYIVKFAYIVAIGQYMKIEELPSGHGIADIVYIPKRYSRLPGMVIELKWNQSAGGAIQQIKDKNYPAIMAQLDGEILLVGINYNSKSNTHTCEIEHFQV